MKHTSLAAFLLLFSPLVSAHPGTHHGDWLSAVMHLLSEPDHLVMALIAVGLGVAGARWVCRRTAFSKPGTRR
jgi:hypothetical protein